MRFTVFLFSLLFSLAASAQIVVESSSTSNGGASGQTHVVSYPAGIQSGETVLCLVSYDNPGVEITATWPPEWTIFFKHWADSANDLAVSVEAAWARGVGNEGPTFTITTDRNEWSSHICMRIGGAADPEVLPPVASAPSEGTSTTPDPPNLDMGVVKEYLWIAAYGNDNGNSNVLSYPPEYPDNRLNEEGGGSSTTQMTSATRLLSAASQDPTAFTQSQGEQWAALTIAVHPGVTGPSSVIIRRTRGY